MGVFKSLVKLTVVATKVAVQAAVKASEERASKIDAVSQKLEAKLDKAE